MTVFVGWIKEKPEHKAAFEHSLLMQIGKRYLTGNWKIIRKIRLVRLIRRVIEEGIIGEGVKELDEEGCRILSEMERRGEEVEEGGEEERYMYELFLLKVRGEQKKVKESAVSVLRREVEGLRREVEEEKKKRETERTAFEERISRIQKEMEAMEKKVEEEKKRADEEKKKREEAERRETEEKRKRVEETKQREEEERRRRVEEGNRVVLITSLDGTSVTFTPSNDGIKREGNTIIHHGDDSVRNCFIGGEMRSV